jgi:RNA polymerase sigma factor (TIGR02999 family)
MRAPGELTLTLRKASTGDRAATDSLFHVLYPELRRLAQSYLSHERPDHTLQATALVHEAYLRLADVPRLEWRDRVHFLAVAARAMRRVLVDHARRRRSAKRPGGRPHLTLDAALTVGAESVNPDLLALNLALSKLEAEEPQKAQVVEMRFFGGMTEEEIAAVLDVTPRTVRRYWAYAQARLYESMTGTDE